MVHLFALTADNMCTQPPTSGCTQGSGVKLCCTFLYSDNINQSLRVSDMVVNTSCAREQACISVPDRAWSGVDCNDLSRILALEVVMTETFSPTTSSADHIVHRLSLSSQSMLTGLPKHH